MDIWKKYSRKHKLGSGMCGPVYVIKDNRTGQEFAGKSVRKNALNARLQSDLLREIGILKQAQWPHCTVKLVEVRGGFSTDLSSRSVVDSVIFFFFLA